MVQWAIGEMEGSSSVRAGPLPAPLEQERQSKEPADCASLGKHSWVEPPAPQGDEIVRDDPLQDCPWSTGGIRGFVQDPCVQPPPLCSCHRGLWLLLWALLAPLHPWILGPAAQPKQAPVQAGPKGRTDRPTAVQVTNPVWLFLSCNLHACFISPSQGG